MEQEMKVSPEQHRYSNRKKQGKNSLERKNA